MEAIGYIRIPIKSQDDVQRYTLVDGDYDGEYFSQYKWYHNPQTGYAFRVGYQWENGHKPITLHREVSCPPKSLIVDHINGDRLDNRSCNLRWVTWQENAWNRTKDRQWILTAFTILLLSR